MLRGLSTVHRLVRAGDFSQANQFFASNLTIEEKRSSQGCLTEAELQIALGDVRGGKAKARKVAQQSTDAFCQAWAVWLIAQADNYLGNPVEAKAHLEKARALAFELRGSQPRFFASVLLTSLRFISRAASVNHLDLQIKEVRRAVLHAADAHLLADLRVTVAELETRKGCLQEALRHLAQAQKLLSAEPNLFLEGVLWNHRSNIYVLSGDASSAREAVTQAVRCGNESGHFRLRIGTQINWAQRDLCDGFTSGLEDRLLRLVELSTDHIQLRLAALDALANYYLATERLREARQCLANILRARRLARDGWAYLTESYSRSNIALLQGDSRRAERLLRQGLEAATLSGDSIWIRNFQLRLAQIEARFEGSDSTDRIIPTMLSISNNAEVYSRVCLTRAVIEQATTSARAAKVVRRVDRITKTLKLFAIREDAKRLGVELAQDEFSDSPSLDDAAALMELAGYPHVLAREAYALLDGADVAERLALVARGPAGIRVLTAARWDEPAAARAAADPQDRLVVVCGQHRDESWEVVAELKPSLSDRCTAVAIRQLVDTAVTLDRYRREEKQRTALWPADTFETDGGLFVSEQMSDLLSIARRIAPSDITVLLTGETGTGKEVLARAIHRASPRAAKPFVPFNCTAVAKDMLESQLFGYRKGAFTGADGAFDGVIRAAAGGTLFLDEIAEIGPDLQPKLLRFLETCEVHGLGEPQPVTVDIRVIAATNADLEAMVADGRFREDLFYRLNGVRLKVPPLRERREEIPPLIDHYLRKAAEELKKGRLTLDDETLEYLLLYSWPGNVRQLVNEIRRAAAFAEPDSVITPALLSAEIQASRRTIRITEGDTPEIRIRLDQPMGDALEAIEQAMVRRALERSHGNYENAARLLGISRKGLFLKRRRWGMQRAS
jgi:DNA-binding NtrC family response regulator